MLRIKAVGAPRTVVRELEEFVERTGADELITVTYAYDPAVRQRSLTLLAGEWFEPPTAVPSQREIQHAPIRGIGVAFGNFSGSIDHRASGIGHTAELRTADADGRIE